jgi:hypothetical protein
LYECKITSAVPGVETASTYLAKPGYFGRPWAATTSEVVVYKAKIETSNYPGSEGLSLIAPEGWSNSLSGTSNNIYEFGTTEVSGINNAANRVSWSKVLTSPALTDATAITTFNFTKGTDGWDPFPLLETLTSLPSNTFSVKVNSVSCNGLSNGSITVASNEQTLTYNVTINSDKLTLDTATGYTKTLENLPAGMYNVCFSTPSIPGYSQCFEIRVVQPDKIVVSSFVSKNSNTITLSMSGATTYNVAVNGVTQTVAAPSITVPLQSGFNAIAVSTNLDCQGVYKENIFVSEEVQYFPNPTSGPVSFYLGGDDAEVKVRIFDLSGNKLSETVQLVPTNRSIGVELSTYTNGVYVVQLEGKTINESFKIIKK